MTSPAHFPQPHEEEVNQKAPEVVGKLADVEQLLGPVADRDMEDMEVLALINKHDALAKKWQDIQDELEKLRKRVGLRGISVLDQFCEAIFFSTFS